MTTSNTNILISTLSKLVNLVFSMTNNLLSSTINISKHSVTSVYSVFNGIISFFGTIVFSSLDLVKAFGEGVINNLMLMVLVTAGFFMYTMYLQRQRELAGQQPKATTASSNTSTTTAQPLQALKSHIPNLTAKPRFATTTANNNGNSTSLFGNGAMPNMPRTQMPQQQQYQQPQQQYRNVPVHSAHAVY